MIENHDWWSGIIIDNWVWGFNENKNKLLSIVRKLVAQPDDLSNIDNWMSMSIIYISKSKWQRNIVQRCANCEDENNKQQNCHTLLRLQPVSQVVLESNVLS